MALSATQQSILTDAFAHPQGVAVIPKKLPGAARASIARALLKGDMVIEVHATPDLAPLAWRTTDDGSDVILRITDAGIRAIGQDPAAAGFDSPTTDAPADSTMDDGDEQTLDAIQRRNAARLAAQEPAQDEPPAEADDDADDAAQGAAQGEAGAVPATGTTEVANPARSAPGPALRAAAAAVIAAWDGASISTTDTALDTAIASLRTLLAGKPARTPREPVAPRKPREGTKQDQVLAMLRRPEGATLAQISDATGWQHHTVRGFFAGLKKRQGIEVTVLQRIRKVGPNQEGARGSYSIYHVA